MKAAVEGEKKAKTEELVLKCGFKYMQTERERDIGNGQEEGEREGVMKDKMESEWKRGRARER